MSTTVDWTDEVTTNFPTEANSSSETVTTKERSLGALSVLVAYMTTRIIIGVLEILSNGSTLLLLGMNGGTACLVVITLDRYWKIVHPIHHREHYRRWMLYVGLVLPWLSGLAAHTIPTISTTRIVNGKCITLALHTVYGVFLFLWQFCIPSVIFVVVYWKILGAVRRKANVAAAGHQRNTAPSSRPVAGTRLTTVEGKRATAKQAKVGSVKDNNQRDVATEAAAGSKGRQEVGGQNKSVDTGLSRAEFNVVKTMIYITVCFTVCWMPLYFYNMLASFKIAWSAVRMRYPRKLSLSLRSAVFLYAYANISKTVIPGSFSSIPGTVVTVASYCNIFANPLIYIAQYDVVKRPLANLVKCNKLSNEQQPVHGRG